MPISVPNGTAPAVPTLVATNLAASPDSHTREVYVAIFSVLIGLPCAAFLVILIFRRCRRAARPPEAAHGDGGFLTWVADLERTATEMSLPAPPVREVRGATLAALRDFFLARWACGAGGVGLHCPRTPPDVERAFSVDPTPERAAAYAAAVARLLPLVAPDDAYPLSPPAPAGEPAPAGGNNWWAFYGTESSSLRALLTRGFVPDPAADSAPMGPGLYLAVTSCRAAAAAAPDAAGGRAVCVCRVVAGRPQLIDPENLPPVPPAGPEAGCQSLFVPPSGRGVLHGDVAVFDADQVVITHVLLLRTRAASPWTATATGGGVSADGGPTTSRTGSALGM